MITNPSEFLIFAINTAKKAGKIQMSHYGKTPLPEKKSNNIDLLTKADTQSEEFIVNEIERHYPSHSILSEENYKLNKNSDYTWVIDPLDGTTNFVHKLPIFGVSIALKKNNIICCGVVYNPAVNKCFYAEKNKGSYLDNDLLNITSSNTLSDSLLVTGFPYLHDKKYDVSFKIFKEFYDRTRGLRRLGSAALDLCFVAMGRFDGFYEFGLNEWDICAGTLIVIEAGGQVTDWNNTKCPDNGERILASNGLIHEEMVKILNQKKYKLFF